MKRNAHRIKDNRGNSIPQRVVFVDTETRWRDRPGDAAIHRLYIGVAYHVVFDSEGQARAKVPFRFTRVGDFWDWVDGRAYAGTRTYLVAHNIHFDIKVLAGFSELKRRGWKLTKFLLTGSAVIIDFRKDKKSIRVLDNLNYFHASLETLGEEIGIPKLTMPSRRASREEWFAYCERDVHVLVAAWEKWVAFVRGSDLGCFAATLAGQSFNAYRHRFMGSGIYIHDRASVLVDERLAYHGGRVECFYLGVAPPGRYYYLDINSMYPSVMATGEYPTKYVRTINAPSRKLVDSVLATHCVVALAVLDARAPIYAAVVNGKLCFPTGRFSAMLTTRELQEAVRRGELVSVERMHLYEKAILFKDYVLYFYEARRRYREAGQPSFAYMSKLLLNSLYGKFGQKNEEWKLVGENPDAPDGIESVWDYQKKKYIRTRSINGRVEESVGFTEGFNSFPAIAAHITADARLKLWSLIEKAGRKNVLYCDTDSIFANEAGFGLLASDIREGELGALGCKGSAEHLEVHGLKDYTFGSEQTLKGIRKNAEKVSEGVYRQLRFEGLRGALAQGDLNTMRVYTIEKRLKRDYQKGVRRADGTVDPIVLTL